MPSWREGQGASEPDDQLLFPGDELLVNHSRLIKHAAAGRAAVTVMILLININDSLYSRLDYRLCALIAWE